jgi:hypothetical protein
MVARKGGLGFEVFVGDDLVVVDDVEVAVAGKGVLEVAFEGFVAGGAQGEDAHVHGILQHAGDAHQFQGLSKTSAKRARSRRNWRASWPRPRRRG